MSGFLKHKAWVIVICLFFAPFFFSTSAFADASLSMSISSSDLVLKLLPKSSDGTFAKSENLTIAVDLTGTGGYTLGIRSDVSGDDATNLVNTIDNTKKFTSISSAISESDFSNASNTQYNNKWGYLPSKYNSANNTNFLPAPSTNGDILDYTEDDNVSRTYTIAVGARADLNTTTGTYTGTFVITAVANFGCNASATTIGDAICMQDMNDDVINSMEEGRQYQLKDNRDWKVYYVAKMKDGRVWMTQNLDLDLETTPNKVAALTHDNTDLGWTVYDANATWTPSAATVTGLNNLGGGDTSPASRDYGETYRYVSADGATTSYSTKASCEAAHNDGTCAHYHVGNYYNWSSAVASNDTSSITANYASAPDSICPAGWRLPASQESSAANSYSEINYTWMSEDLVQGYVSINDATRYKTNGWINIRNNPMYMVTAGYSSSNRIINLGSNGSYWTRTIYSGTTAYATNYNSTLLYPAYYNSGTSGATRRFNALSIRCIARQDNTGSTIITFDKNANDATGSMNNQNYSANSLNNLPAVGFSRTGYRFMGWNTKTDGSGESYDDEALYYAITGTTTNEITLYAQWTRVYTITFNMDTNTDGVYFDGSIYTNGQTTQVLEGRTYTLVGVYKTKYGHSNWSVTAGSIAGNYNSTTYTVTNNATITATSQIATVDMTTLTNPSNPVSNTCKNEPVVPELVYDPRDNEAYYVARMCDGKYWMLDNLRLDLVDQTVVNGLNSSNTNASDSVLSYLKNGGGTLNDQYAVNRINSSQWTSGSSFYVPQARSDYKDNIAPVINGLGSGKEGVYYNYCAVSAGSYCWGGTSNPTTDPNPNSQTDIEGDICPIGWHLPTSSNDGNSDYGALYASYSGADQGQNNAFIKAFAMDLAGYVYNGSLNGAGFSVDYPSSTWNSDKTMLGISYNTNGTPPIVTYSNQYRNYGRVIRCVLNNN